MRMKPKSTTQNPRALLYRRFIGIEKSFNLNALYLTTDGKYWLFNSEELTFSEYELAIPTQTKITNVESSSILNFQDRYFKYTDKWEEIEKEDNVTLLPATFNNIGKYQVNKYYFAGSFDYMIKGSVEGTTTQYLKGNITPLTSLNIKHFNDYINLNPDDLVVIGNRLYSVENPQKTIKMQPKPYNVYYATLNSIL